MLAATSPHISRRKLDHPAVVGKDILEVLSSAMYVDPLCIYREYIQNATDAIDEARAAGFYTEPVAPRIDITLDLQRRSVRIRDNGIGIPPNVFARRLTALGASKKRGSSARGFRGVGRLAGVAYCQNLIFRAKAKNAPHVWEIHWDCVRLKSLLQDATYGGDLHDVMSEVVEFNNVPATGVPEHFFEVELRGVKRIRNDVLLNESVVEEYLSQVAPLPFSTDFSFAVPITEHLAKHKVGGTYNIFLSGRSTYIIRPFTTSFYAKRNIRDTFREVEFFEIPGVTGELDAAGWFLHHSYHGALPHHLGIKGLRLRAGNLQVGDDTVFDTAFAEPRFNSWTVGEVHLLSKRLIPNGRRDDLEQSVHQQKLISQVSLHAKRLTKLCRSSSAKRNQMRTHPVDAENHTVGSKALIWSRIPNLDRQLRTMPSHKQRSYKEVLLLFAQCSGTKKQFSQIRKPLLKNLMMLARS